MPSVVQYFQNFHLEEALQTQTKRNEIAQEYTWNLESIFSTNDEWEAGYRALAKTIPEFEDLKDTLAQSGHALFYLLQKRDAAFETLERLFVYASLRKDEDTTNNFYQGLYERGMQLYVRATTATSFIEPEILALPQEKLDQFIRETPELALYKQQLHDLNRNRPHVRSSEIEAILAAAGEISEAPDS